MRTMAAMQRGFTLVELMVALFITAILFAMGYGAINQVLGNTAALEAQQARLLAVQTTMRTFAQDFEQATARPVRQPVGTEWEAAFESASQSQGQKVPALVTLTRGSWANPAGVQRPALQRVSYSFENNVLTREHWPVLDTTLASEPIRRELLTGVKSIAFRYMDAPGHWTDRWPGPSTQAGQSMSNQPERSQLKRPLAVEMTLELEDWGEIVRLFEIPQ